LFAKLKPLPDCMLGCSKPFSTWGITTKPACVVPAMLEKNASILVHELVRLNVLSVAAGCLSNPPLLADSRRFAQHLVLTGEHTSCRVGEVCTILGRSHRLHCSARTGANYSGSSEALSKDRYTPDRRFKFEPPLPEDLLLYRTQTSARFHRQVQTP
jgi:hypothetical protein